MGLNREFGLEFRLGRIVGRILAQGESNCAGWVDGFSGIDVPNRLKAGLRTTPPKGGTPNDAA